MGLFVLLVSFGWGLDVEGYEVSLLLDEYVFLGVWYLVGILNVYRVELD